MFYLRLAPLVLFGLAINVAAAAEDLVPPSAPAPRATPPVEDQAALTALARRLAFLAPAGAEELRLSAAQALLSELRNNTPAEVDRLNADESAAEQFDSTLLQVLASQLKGASHAAEREQLACRRIEVVVGATPSGADGRELLALVKKKSSVAYQQISEGRMSDERLRELVESLRHAANSNSAAALAAGPLTADGIVAKYARQNGYSEARFRLQALTLEAVVTGATPGEGETKVLIFKLRPNRIRLHYLREERTVMIVASNGTYAWRQRAGGQVERLSPEGFAAVESRAAFEPLLLRATSSSDAGEIERLPDGEFAGRQTFRLSVPRPGRTPVVVHLDCENFRGLGHESDNGSVRFDDFRTIAGVTLPFFQESVGLEGRKQTARILRATPNSGVLPTFFDPPPTGPLDHFVFEHLVTNANATQRPPTHFQQ